VNALKASLTLALHHIRDTLLSAYVPKPPKQRRERTEFATRQ
jgi:hypothetical protein